MTGKQWTILHEQIIQVHCICNGIRNGAVVDAHQCQKIEKCSICLVCSFRFSTIILYHSFSFNHNFFWIYSNDLYLVHELRLEFNSPPRMCNEHSDYFELSTLNAQGEFIDVNFHTGFQRTKLLSLLSEMVCTKMYKKVYKTDVN